MARVQAIQELLRMPQEVLPFALISIGHPVGPPPEVDRFLPERIHSNQW
jgi:nitroreductase